MKKETSFDLCVLGGGPGGLSAAVRAAQQGATVCLVDPGPIGGTCLNRGCIPARAFGTTARLYSQLRRAETFGIQADNVRLDLKGVLARKERILRRLRTSLVHLLDKFKVTWFQGEGIVHGPHEVEIYPSGKPMTGISAQSIILATGSRPQFLPGCQLDGKTIVTSNELLDLEKIPSSLIIIGAGVIGSEFASYFSDLGVAVTLLEAASRVLPSEDEGVSDAFCQTLRRRGVQIFTHTPVKSVERGISGEGEVTQSDGQTLKADLVLVATGRTPQLPKGVEQLGLRVEKGCLVVDELLRTTIPSIFGIGDLLGNYQLACTASYEGALAAENALGAVRKVDYSVVPEPIYTDPEIASVGLTRAEAQADGKEVTVSRINVSGLARAQTLEETEGFVQVVADRSTGRLLGVQIIAARATDIIGEAALGIKQGLSLRDLAETLHGHPTMSESVWEVASLALGQSIYYAQNK